MTVPIELDYLGPNRDLVREVMEFAFSQAIVSAIGPPEQSDTTIVTNDVVRAVDAAGLASDESRFLVGFSSGRVLALDDWPCADDVSWSSEEGWAGLRSSFVAKYIQTKAWYQWHDEHEMEIAKCVSLAVQWDSDTPMHLHDHLREIIPEGPRGPDGDRGYYREFMINEIACDMMECCKNRAINGKTDNFWERLFSVYLDGLWPCCWLGRWPGDGRLLVWRRSA